MTRFLPLNVSPLLLPVEPQGAAAEDDDAEDENRPVPDALAVPERGVEENSDFDMDLNPSCCDSGLVFNV
jgi:hypothetical protein